MRIWLSIAFWFIWCTFLFFNVNSNCSPLSWLVKYILFSFVFAIILPNTKYIYCHEKIIDIVLQICNCIFFVFLVRWFCQKIFFILFLIIFFFENKKCFHKWFDIEWNLFYFFKTFHIQAFLFSCFRYSLSLFFFIFPLAEHRFIL